MLDPRRRGAAALWLALLASAAIAGCTDGDSVVGGNRDASVDVGTDIGPQCTAPQSACGGRCVDLQASRENCGTCGNACPGAQVCVAGSCQIGCPGAQQACGGACVTLSTDRANCGACGTACP
ncbi:MAG: Tryptophan synthase alpha chain, partial [Myxococcaceae bacterium]|nr:Tryptophan synthase alpha chain [Myxococcaceae bacterium]